MHRPTSVSEAAPLAAAATAAACATGIAVAFLAWPAAAVGSTSSHTLHLTSKRAAEVQFGRAGFTEADKVHARSGAAVGTSVSDCTPVSSSMADCSGALALKGGVLEARFALNFTTGEITGKVTGGTMAYKHATGTVAGTSFNGGSRLKVTYHL